MFRCLHPVRTAQRKIMSIGIDPIVSSTRGTLIGYAFWLATIVFIFAIIIGIVG